MLLVACSSSSADVHWRQSTRSHGGAACPRKRQCYLKPGQQPRTPRSLTRFQQGSRLRVALADTSCPVAAYTVCFHQVTPALWLPAWDAVLWQRRFKFSLKKADESKCPAGGYLLRLFAHARAASLHQYHNQTFDCANGTYHRIISTVKPQLPKIQKG